MWQFIKYVFATIVGIFLFTLLAFFLLIGIGAAVGSSDEKTTVADNSILKLSLDAPIQEVSVENPFAEFSGGEGDVLGLIDIKEAIANAKLDPNIKGIYLDAQYPQAGWASLEEIREALLDFKTAKKFVYAYGEVMTEKAYYLASTADKIFLNPSGGMEWNGLSAEYEFYKGTLDKLEVKPLVFRVGDFKSAVEPFYLDKMSDASKLQSKALVSGIFEHVINNIAKSRGLSVAQLNKLADSLSVDSAQDALKYKLITHAGYYDELESAIKKELKLDEDEKINFVSLGKYGNAEKYLKEGNSNNRIAVIVGEGAIMSGNGDETTIGSDKIAAELVKARKDKKVKAVVLRINSPGGSALASDVMWREVQLTRKVKPVIASLSDVAASGGYYMAMGCDKIVAQPTTITGSIGVFSVLFDMSKFTKNKLGITFDRVNTHAHADAPTLTREMTAFELNKMQRSTENIYETFTRKAAEGRKMPQDKLKSIASGRVWLGKDAKVNGLIDEFGGLNKAIEMAAQSAKLKTNDYRVRYYPAKKNVFDQLMNKFSGEAEERIIANQLGDFAPYLRTLKKLRSMEGTQALMPFEINVR
jgi:protease IV